MSKRLFLVLIAVVSFGFASQISVRSESNRPILSEPSSHSSLPFPYKYVRNAIDNDTVKVLAIRVEFQRDDDDNTTGNGRFGIWDGSDSTLHSVNDKKELAWYKAGDYPFDRLPHDSLYISQKLDYLVSYYNEISNGKLTVEYEVFPKGKNEKDAYQLPLKMALYSPGQKIDTETFLDFNYRSFFARMSFYLDAIQYSDQGVTEAGVVSSPFDRIIMDEEGVLWEVDENGIPKKRVVVCIIHAGASNLTDARGNSTSDLVDKFMSEDFIHLVLANFREDFQDHTTEIDGRVGFNFTGYNDSTYIISEMMMISETSNQDSVSYGTHGIMVNQFARQLGIPDLYSTSSQSTGIGRFGIMDFQGYSTASGFIPPYPSAWTRLYMGWTSAKVVQPGESYDISAVGLSNDTTVALIPLNAKEYWLVENRQRNLTGDSSLFTYDTAHTVIYIDPDSSVNFETIVDSVTPDRGVIMSTKSRDIGLPASGLAVWHIDEDIIDNRLIFNYVNTDSSYRGVSLEEADGVEDLGTFYNSYTGPIYDYGTAEDVYPHFNKYYPKEVLSSTDFRYEFTPLTSPATTANDGGNSHIQFTFDTTLAVSKETNRLSRATSNDNKHYDYFVENYVAPKLRFSVAKNTELSITRSDNWPIPLNPVKHFELLSMDINRDGEPEIISLDTSGILSVLTSEGVLLPDSSNMVNSTLYITDSIPSVYTYPTDYNGTMFIPTSSGSIYSYSAIVAGQPLSRSILSTGKELTTAITASSSDKWYVGCSDGDILVGSNSTITDSIIITDTLKTGNSAPVTALSLLNNVLYAVDESGTVTLFDKTTVLSNSFAGWSKTQFFPPYTMVSGDLNNNGIVEIAVVDSKQGLVLLQHDSEANSLLPHDQVSFQRFPNDWAGYYHIDTGRVSLQSNGAEPSLADITGDGNLEIIIPGANGVFAFSHIGVMIPHWPVILNKPFWSKRHSILSSVVTVKDSEENILTLFSSPTGDNLTYEPRKVDSIAVDRKNSGKYIMHYTNSNGFQDSISDVDSLYVFDTLLVQEDSLFFPYVMPGGLIDARNNTAKRPDTTVKTNTISNTKKSTWPLTLGSGVRNAPLFVQGTADKHSLYGINVNGVLYKWDVDTSLISSADWPVVGGNAQRQFSRSAVGDTSAGSETVESFYTYPNPLRLGSDSNSGATFRYELQAPATNVKLSIFMVDGRKVYESTLPKERGINEFVLSDLSRFGSAVYNCRLEVNFPGSEVVRFWKMVVLRGDKWED